MGTDVMTAVVVFKSLWWIIPSIIGLTVAIVVEHYEER